MTKNEIENDDDNENNKLFLLPDSLKLRVMREEGMDEVSANKALEAYRQFMKLKFRLEDYEADGVLIAYPLVAAVWKQHVLDTKAYQKSCEEYFGDGVFIHYDPENQLGGGGGANVKNLVDRIRTTKIALNSCFGRNAVDCDIWDDVQYYDISNNKNDKNKKKDSKGKKKKQKHNNKEHGATTMKDPDPPPFAVDDSLFLVSTSDASAVSVRPNPSNEASSKNEGKYASILNENESNGASGSKENHDEKGDIETAKNKADKKQSALTRLQNSRSRRRNEEIPELEEGEILELDIDFTKEAAAEDGNTAKKGGEGKENKSGNDDAKPGNTNSKTDVFKETTNSFAVADARREEKTDTSTNHEVAVNSETNSPATPRVKNGHIVIGVRNFENEQETHFRLPVGLRIKKVCKTFLSLQGAEHGDFTFTFNEQLLDEDQTPTSLNMNDGDCIVALPDGWAW